MILMPKGFKTYSFQKSIPQNGFLTIYTNKSGFDSIIPDTLH